MLYSYISHKINNVKFAFSKSFLKVFLLFSIYILLLPAQGCIGGESGSVGSSLGSAPAAPSAPNGETNNTTVASAAPVAQPTQPAVPEGSVWMKGRVIMEGTDKNAPCDEVKFKTFPTIKVLEKTNDTDWELRYEVGKPDYRDSQETIDYYMCGKFSTSFGFWGGMKDPCYKSDWVDFTKKSIMFEASYEENGKIFKGSSREFSCSDQSNPPSDLVITLYKQEKQPSLAMPASYYNNYLNNSQ